MSGSAPVLTSLGRVLPQIDDGLQDSGGVLGDRALDASRASAYHAEARTGSVSLLPG